MELRLAVNFGLLMVGHGCIPKAERVGFFCEKTYIYRFKFLIEPHLNLSKLPPVSNSD